MIRYATLLLCGLAACATRTGIYNPPLKMVVKAPVANVRSEPLPHDGQYKYDPKQETQIEKGEPVLVYERREGWVRIEVPEQLEYSHHSKWEGYPGWTKWENLSRDLKLIHTLKKTNLPEKELRKKILENAKNHLGNSYLWGGRSLHNSDVTGVATGVDCSGLVNWSFRQEGWFIPRDSHEQHMRARPTEPEDMKPADLLFLAKKEKPEKIVHVAFYVGDGHLLEAPYSGEKVRQISFQERFGTSLRNLKNGSIVKNHIIYFGSYFAN